MIYLIGGAPRVGKTRLIEKLVAQKPMHAISTDAIRSMLRQTVPKHDLSPDLFLSSEEYVERQKIAHILKDQNAESDALWPYLVAFMQSYVDDNYDLALEGVAILPALVNKLHIPHKVIIVGNNMQTHAETVRQQALASSRDWLHAYSKEQVETYTNFFAYMSDWLEAEAVRYHMPYVEIHDDTFEDDLQRAAQRLLT